MKRKNLALDRGRQLFNDVIDNAERFPVSFTYDGKKYVGLGAAVCIQRGRITTSDGELLTAAWEIDEMLTVRVEARYCAAYGQSEYTVWFENTGSQPTGVLGDVVALDYTFAGENGVARGILGDQQFWYTPYEIDLTKQTAFFESKGGRATHVSFPYFNLVHGDGGTLCALGWAGTWDAMFTTVGKGLKARVRSNPVLNAVLMPGESVRTGLVVLLPYHGRSDDDAMNLWREWFINCSMPRANAAGAAIEPFSTACFANDTGLPNSDGSISERYFTWKPSLDKVVEEGVAPDFRWFDAGWYCDPAGNTVETDWWGTVGTWSIDEEKWPGETFRESVEGFHKHGVKTLMWFEPERVTNVDDLVKNWGYKPEWAIAAGRSITNNIGDPECLKWTANRVISMLERGNVDLYREDNNANHNLTWKKLDSEESEKYGLPRWGVAENNSIVGHYKLWDTILEYCAATGKCTFVDSCASGGGRNDIESLRRGVPFMRSDADRTTSALRLSMSASFNRWIPFHGSCTKETATELESSAGAGSDAYVYRASYLPIFNYLEAFVHNPLLDYDNMRKFIGEWRSVNHLLVKDMYTLTPWHSEHDRCGWTALCYDDPDKGESLLLGFRMEDCEEDSCTVRLPFAQPEATYVLTDEDTGEKLTLSGEKLLAGLTLRLDQPRSCVMYRMMRG